MKNKKNKIIAQKEKMVELSNRLHEADQAKLNFYTNVSHEFRTPLTIIMGNLETLKDQGVSQLLLRNVKRSTERLFRLVNQFIDLRKYDKGELKLAISRLDIVSFTRDILESFQELANRQNIHLSLEKSEEKIFLWLDQDKTDKILYNLLSNAIKYTDSEGSVHVSFFQKEKGLELRITDTGRGISEEDQLNIFNGFFRGKETSYLTDGHGIGLSLVKALVDIQKAEIGCTSKIGSGTSFHILFKWGNLHFNEEDIAENEEIPFLHETETLPIHEIISTNLLGEEILLVEDNPELLDFLSTLLGKYYNIKTAANGKDALMKIANNTPDLIITDLMMPRMDGIEFCKAVRERLETRFVPIIILSAKTDVSSKMEGYQINIDDYIEKPFHPSLLLTRISSVLNKRQEIRKNIDNLILIPQDKRPLQKTDKIFLEKVLDILELHYSDQDFSIDNLSSEMGMSRVTFYRKIKKISGEGPGEFIRKFRMQKAATLLRENSKTIEEVCSDVGFQSLPHFRKNFKQEFGVLPSKYR
ncbi:hybrid sensor histidine kinase/response regulator transcription factor [Gaoshiqia sediminis]|uniref:histidine kinase n=1 Tax=Gaoshiqia sediminis TaxID=2986998 RepID=A0AA41YE38_9BACT|nr:response regulator [Gaoshiqia sediminis]MCW0483942.1 response regulator [Gaoshiqia sediminis]